MNFENTRFLVGDRAFGGGLHDVAESSKGKEGCITGHYYICEEGLKGASNGL